MDPGEGKDNEDERPFCKVCGTYDDLMVPQVCICTGSVANICSDCLLQTIRHRDVNAPTDDRGEPICPDCHTPYQNISYRWRRDTQTFNQYMVNHTGMSLLQPIVRSILYTLPIGLFGAGIFLTPVPDHVVLFMLRFLLCFAWLFGTVFFGRGIMGIWRTLYQLYGAYLNRIPQVIDHFVRQIGPKESVYIKMEDDATNPAPLPAPLRPPPPSPQIRPQPPIEPHIPHARPQPQLGPILSRRGRRWSRPQQTSQPQPSARQRQSHTPRRSWTQQPKSRHQSRRQ